MSAAGETGGKRGTLLSWKPYRPSEQRDARSSHNDNVAHAAETNSSASPGKRIVVDSQVRRAALQQADDPLGNPFDDPMPKSPFRSSKQSAPAEINELPEPAAESSEPTLPTSQREPERFPQDSAAPPADDSSPRPTFGGLEPLPGADLADPKQDCQTALNRMKANRLNQSTSRGILDLRPSEAGEVPYECTFGEERVALNSGRDWPETCYTWKASGLCHKPLYFEQAHMERYGHSWGPVLDPVISGAHFFASVPLLPYKMGLEPPCECIYPLGYYRPGSCAPRYIEPWPWSIRGAALEGAAFTGLFYAVP